MGKNLTGIELQSYYSGLNRTEKSLLIRYLMLEFDYRYASIQQKLTGKAEFNKRDLILIGEVIEQESWRQ